MQRTPCHLISQDGVFSFVLHEASKVQKKEGKLSAVITIHQPDLFFAFPDLADRLHAVWLQRTPEHGKTITLTTVHTLLPVLNALIQRARGHEHAPALNELLWHVCHAYSDFLTHHLMQHTDRVVFAIFLQGKRQHKTPLLAHYLTLTSTRLHRTLNHHKASLLEHLHEGLQHHQSLLEKEIDQLRAEQLCTSAPTGQALVTQAHPWGSFLLRQGMGVIFGSFEAQVTRKTHKTHNINALLQGISEAVFSWRERDQPVASIASLLQGARSTIERSGGRWQLLEGHQSRLSALMLSHQAHEASLIELERLSAACPKLPSGLRHAIQQHQVLQKRAEAWVLPEDVFPDRSLQQPASGMSFFS